MVLLSYETYEPQQQLAWHDDQEYSSDTYILEVTGISIGGLKAFSTRGKLFLVH